MSAANNLFETLATSAGTQSGFTEWAASNAMQRFPMAASRSFSKALCIDEVLCFESCNSFPEEDVFVEATHEHVLNDSAAG